MVDILNWNRTLAVIGERGHMILSGTPRTRRFRYLHGSLSRKVDHEVGVRIVYLQGTVFLPADVIYCLFTSTKARLEYDALLAHPCRHSQSCRVCATMLEQWR